MIRTGSPSAMSGLPPFRQEARAGALPVEGRPRWPPAPFAGQVISTIIRTRSRSRFREIETGQRMGGAGSFWCDLRAVFIRLKAVSAIDRHAGASDVANTLATLSEDAVTEVLHQSTNLLGRWNSPIVSPKSYLRSRLNTMRRTARQSTAQREPTLGHRMTV